ncbi:MAG: hypothetical protein AAFV69_15620, partial [Pseudomonadota bacterium]
NFDGLQGGKVKLFPVGGRTTWRGANGEGVKAMVKSSSSFEMGTHLAWTLACTDPTGKVLQRQKMDLDKGYLP